MTHYVCTKKSNRSHRFKVGRGELIRSLDEGEMVAKSLVLLGNNGAVLGVASGTTYKLHCAKILPKDVPVTKNVVYMACAVCHIWKH